MADMYQSTAYYLSLTIGPVYRTIANARKTRELWAASFLLSQFMRCLLEGLEKYGEALSPDLSNLHSPKKWHGAGIWNDNCYFKIHSEKVESLRKELPGIIATAKKQIVDLAVLDIVKKGLELPEAKIRGILAEHFHCHAALIEQTNEADADMPILKQLSALNASTEMRDLFPAQHDDFVSKTMFRGDTVKGLYHLGFEHDDIVFTRYPNKFDRHETLRRMPSLLEVGLREFRDNEHLYSKIQDIISENSQDYGAESDVENQAILDLLKPLKDEQGNPVFKKRHKYIAVVQSDGDGVGSLISSQQDDSEIKALSKKLMQFSTNAVDKIVEFDGLPVYAGGDDLLFIAPLKNSAGRNVYDLLADIQNEFKAKLQNGTSISFGVSIFYYKYPLGEALENGRELLQTLAKKLIFHKKGQNVRLEKNALAFRVMLHAGQSFAAVLRQEGDTWENWKALVKAGTGQDLAFVAGVVHTLERLGYLLEQACNDGTTASFFKHHFNEAQNTPRWGFVQELKLLAEAVHQEYGTLFPPDDQGIKIDPDTEMQFFTAQIQYDKDQQGTTSEALAKRHTAFRNNLIYAALRMIQFLNADDHE